MSKFTSGKVYSRYRSATLTPVNKENKGVPEKCSPIYKPLSFRGKSPVTESSKSVHTSKIVDSLLSRSRGDHQSKILSSLNTVKALSTRYSSRQNRVKLQKKTGFESRKTLIFDLDETLVHCSNEIMIGSDIVMPIRLPDGILSSLCVKVRPFAKECLIEASRHFEVIVFTASEKQYADPIISFLDPSRKLIQHRLYREHCTSVHGVLVKDLRILNGRRLKDMVIVDNNVHSFGYQLENGIPIVSWFGDSEDQELKYLMDYFKKIKEAEDVRDINRNTFKLRELFQDYSL